MCYSAQIKADYHHFLREWGAVISIKRFVELFWEKRKDSQWSKIPKAMREAFCKPEDEEGFKLAKLVAEADREQAEKYQAELGAQSIRLEKAKASLPLLRQAEEIIVLDGEQDAFQVLGNGHARLPLAAWLDRQGLSGQWRPMNPPPTLDMGELIHQRAMDMDADLLVMGAWGHSRMSELMLGGVTRYMLRNAQLPVLYAL